MRAKKLGIILIALAFLLIIVFSCVSLFVVKRVDVSFSVSENTNGEEVYQKLEDCLGKNLLFFDTDKVYELLADESYIEILSVKKAFPNVLQVELKERREIFYVRSGEKVFATTDEGFVIRELSESQINAGVPLDRILLEFKDVELLDLFEGKNFSAENKELVQTIFDMVRNVNFADCVKSINIKKFPGVFGADVYDVYFSTYSGVELVVEDLLISGVQKAVNAFYVYDTILTDYQKADGVIQSFAMADGNLRVTYNQQIVWTSGN